MSAANAYYQQRGETLDYTNASGSKIDANTLVTIGDRVGVADRDIPDGETAVLHVSGVFRVTKSSSNVIAMGKTVYYDGEGITEAADDSGNPATAYVKVGYAAAPAAASDTEILVKLNG